MEEKDDFTDIMETNRYNFVFRRKVTNCVTETKNAAAVNPQRRDSNYGITGTS